jgi:hypothetical protein
VRKKKPTTKVKPISKRKESLTKLVYEDVVISFKDTFPLTLNLSEGKVCYFQCQEHLDKYIERNKLKPKDYKVSKTQEKAKNILELLDEL